MSFLSSKDIDLILNGYPVFLTPYREIGESVHKYQSAYLRNELMKITIPDEMLGRKGEIIKFLISKIVLYHYKGMMMDGEPTGRYVSETLSQDLTQQLLDLGKLGGARRAKPLYEEISAKLRGSELARTESMIKLKRTFVTLEEAFQYNAYVGQVVGRDLLVDNYILRMEKIDWWDGDVGGKDYLDYFLRLELDVRRMYRSQILPNMIGRVIKARVKGVEVMTSPMASSTNNRVYIDIFAKREMVNKLIDGNNEKQLASKYYKGPFISTFNSMLLAGIDEITGGEPREFNGLNIIDKWMEIKKIHPAFYEDIYNGTKDNVWILLINIQRSKNNGITIEWLENILTKSGCKVLKIRNERIIVQANKDPISMVRERYTQRNDVIAELISSKDNISNIKLVKKKYINIIRKLRVTILNVKDKNVTVQDGDNIIDEINSMYNINKKNKIRTYNIIAHGNNLYNLAILKGIDISRTISDSYGLPDKNKVFAIYGIEMLALYLIRTFAQLFKKVRSKVGDREVPEIVYNLLFTGVQTSINVYGHEKRYVTKYFSQACMQRPGQTFKQAAPFGALEGTNSYLVSQALAVRFDEHRKTNIVMKKTNRIMNDKLSELLEEREVTVGQGITPEQTKEGVIIEKKIYAERKIEISEVMKYLIEEDTSVNEIEENQVVTTTRPETYGFPSIVAVNLGINVDEKFNLEEEKTHKKLSKNPYENIDLYKKLDKKNG